MENIKQQIINSYDSLTKNEQKLAEFIISNYDQISHYRGEDIAAAVGTSDTTLVRFTKKLKLSGYIELKNKISQEQLNKNLRSPYLSRTTTPIMDKIMESTCKDVCRLGETVNQEKIKEAAKILLQANRVYLFGIGSDEVLVQYLNNYLPLCGIPCTLISDQGITLREQILYLSKNDILLMSNFPKIEEDEYRLANYAKNIGCKIISITDSDLTAQKLHSYIHFVAKETSDTFYNSPLLGIIICNLILSEINHQQPKKVEEALKNHQIIGDLFSKTISN